MQGTLVWSEFERIVKRVHLYGKKDQGIQRVLLRGACLSVVPVADRHQRLTLGRLKSPAS
jgi:hypothetical protein